MSIIIILLCVIIITQSLDVVIERIVVEYVNPEYGKYIKAGFARTHRRSPYYLSIQFISYQAFGDNVTFRGSMWERLSGGYQPTPLLIERKLCDFYHNDPWIGQIVASQFPPNESCPFQAGFHNFSGFRPSFGNIPYIPFAYDALTVSLRANISMLVTGTDVHVCDGAVYFRATQKPKDKFGRHLFGTNA